MTSLMYYSDVPKDGDLNGHVNASIYWTPFGSSDVLIIDTIIGIIIGSIMDTIIGTIIGWIMCSPPSHLLTPFGVLPETMDLPGMTYKVTPFPGIRSTRNDPIYCTGPPHLLTPLLIHFGVRNHPIYWPRFGSIIGAINDTIIGSILGYRISPFWWPVLGSLLTSFYVLGTLINT